MKHYTDSEFFDSPFRGVTSVLNAIFGNKFENYLNQKIITKKSQMSRLDQMLQEEIYGKSRNNNHNQSNLLGLPDTNQQY